MAGKFSEAVNRKVGVKVFCVGVVFIPEEILVVKTTKGVIAKRCVWLFGAGVSCFVDFTFKERSSDQADTTLVQRLI